MTQQLNKVMGMVCERELFHIEAYECFGKCACRESVVTTCDCTDEAFHNAYLRLTGYTEQEYREKLKQDSPTVYAARVASGIYQEA